MFPSVEYKYLKTYMGPGYGLWVGHLVWSLVNGHWFYFVYLLKTIDQSSCSTQITKDQSILGILSWRDKYS